MMIHSPELYINALPYNAKIKTTIRAIATIRLRGRRCQASYDGLGRWISASRRIVWKMRMSKEFLEVVDVIRRGKKQTNLYYLKPWLWSRLTNGRKVPHVKSPQGETQLPERREPSNLLALFASELAKTAEALP